MHVKTTQAQMSESLWTVTFLTLSGGLQDAYTYFERGKVFANAMTGNLVLLSAHAFELDLAGFVRYLIPVLAFAFGMLIAMIVHLHFQHSRFHWRQLIVLIEIMLLSVVPWIGEDLVANSLVTFCCALQVASFRKFHGIPFSSTMCIGNLRGGTSMLVRGIHEHDAKLTEASKNYFLIIFIFILGAGIGRLLCLKLGLYTILISVALLLCSLAMMSAHPDLVDNSSRTRSHRCRHHRHSASSRLHTAPVASGVNEGPSEEKESASA